jgi:hypothetical protein
VLVFAEIKKRMLYELAKLTGEVKQLNSQMREMRSLMEGVVSGPVTVNNVVVPELEQGPIKTCEKLKSFLDCCQYKEVQAFLVCTLFYYCFQ